MDLVLNFSLPENLIDKPIAFARLAELRGVMVDNQQEGFMKEFFITAKEIQTLYLEEENSAVKSIKVTLSNLAIFFLEADQDIDKGLKLYNSLHKNWIANITLTEAILVLQNEGCFETTMEDISRRPLTKNSKYKDFEAPYMRSSVNFYNTPSLHCIYSEEDVDKTIYTHDDFLLLRGYKDTPKLELAYFHSPLMSELQLVNVAISDIKEDLKTAKKAVGIKKRMEAKDLSVIEADIQSLL